MKKKCVRPIASLTMCALLLCGCMTPSQRYKTWKNEQNLRYAQKRTYEPMSMTAKEGVTLQTHGETTFTLTVPLEQIGQTSIPDDVKTVADFTKWAIGAGLMGYAIHQASGNTTTTNNNYATPEAAQ